MTEADLYTIVKVARNEDLAEQIGRDRYFDLVDHNKVRSFHIKRWTPFNLFKEEVAKEFGIPIQFQRFWLWAKRQNNTYHPHRHVKPQQEAQPPWETYQSNLSIDLRKHHVPKTFLYKVSFRTVKILRVLTDIMFKRFVRTLLNNEAGSWWLPSLW